MSDEKITLTLSDLKEYFQIWHKNNFKDIHSKLEELFHEYLYEKANYSIIDNIKTVLVSYAQVMTKMIDGSQNISNNSSFSDIINILSNKKNSINNDEIYNLRQISTDIKGHNTAISNLENNKVSSQTLDTTIETLRNEISNQQIQIKNIPIDNETDLNSYTTAGIYRSSSSANTGNLENKPENNTLTMPFSLVVLPHMNNSVRQILLTGNETSANDNDNRIYIRNYNHAISTSWSEWYELYGTHNTTKLNMQVSWSDGSEDTTYTLLQTKR